MDIWQILMTPFSWLLKMFCQLFNSYGIALFLFTIVVKILLFPLNLKSKRSMIQMNIVNGQLKELQQRYGKDQERYNVELQKFYSENGISPFGGCGWSLVPMLILYPMYAIIRRPFKYMMWLSEEAVTGIAGALGWAAQKGAEFTGVGYNELYLAGMMNAGNLEAAKNAVAATGGAAASVFVVNFDFFGLDLSQIPQIKFWADGISWNSVGLFLLPLISAALSLVSSLILQKTNQVNRNQEVKMNWGMLLMSPLLSLWIGFAMPAGLCIYWIANSLLMMIQEVICGRMLRKDYEAAQREMEAQAQKAKEEEKERRRQAAERKAAAIAAGKSAKKQNQSKPKGMDLSASREGLRAYARGRAYDPDRYPITPYRDPDGPAAEPELEEETAFSAPTAPVQTPPDSQEPPVTEEEEHEEQ